VRRLVPLELGSFGSSEKKKKELRVDDPRCPKKGQVGRIAPEKCLDQKKRGKDNERFPEEDS